MRRMAPTEGVWGQAGPKRTPVQLDRNSGWPTGRKTHGNGASRVLVGDTTHQGVRENLIQGGREAGMVW
jgi:hypothetical protein